MTCMLDVCDVYMFTRQDYVVLCMWSMWRETGGAHVCCYTKDRRRTGIVYRVIEWSVEKVNDEGQFICRDLIVGGLYERMGRF